MSHAPYTAVCFLPTLSAIPPVTRLEKKPPMVKVEVTIPNPKVVISTQVGAPPRPGKGPSGPQIMDSWVLLRAEMWKPYWS